MKKEPTTVTIQAWIQLHRANQILLESVEDALKKHGLPPLSWYDVLLELNREKSEGLRQFEIGNKILLNKHNLSRLIDRLEKDQLVIRYICSEDGRGNRIKITEKGEKMLKKMWPVYSQAIQTHFGNILKPDEFIELSRILGKLIDKSEIT